MKSALITGASGFIGGHLVERLRSSGFQTRCLVRATSRTERLESLGAELVPGDTSDPDSLARAARGVDLVFHLAGKTCALRREELFRVNAQGAANVAAACAAQPQPPILIHVSSIAAAGPSSHRRLRTEADSPQPVSQYGRSKLAGEDAVRQFSDQVATTIVRPGVVFGEFDPGMVPVAKSIKNVGIHLNAGFRSPKLSIIYVRDLVDVLLLAAERGERLAPRPQDAPGQGIYFGARSDYPTYLDLGRIMAPALRDNGRGPRLICVPSPAAFVLAVVNEGISWCRGKPDIFSRDKLREGLVPSWACSAEKVETQFAWRPSGPLEDQLLHTARWYCEQGWV